MGQPERGGRGGRVGDGQPAVFKIFGKLQCQEWSQSLEKKRITQFDIERALDEAKYDEKWNTLKRRNNTTNIKDPVVVDKYTEYKAKPDPQDVVNKESEKKKYVDD